MPLNSMRMLLDKLTCCRSQCSKTYCTEHHVKNIECNIKNTIKKKKDNGITVMVIMRQKTKVSILYYKEIMINKD